MPGKPKLSYRFRQNLTWIAVFAFGLVHSAFALAHPPTGIVVDRQGRVAFVDFTRNRILRVDRDGTLATVFEDKDGSRFTTPHHLFLDAEGNLYSASDRGSIVWRIAPGGSISRFFPPAGPKREMLEVGLGGDPFAVYTRGGLFVWKHRQHESSEIVKIAPEGKIVSLAGSAWGFADGKGNLARFGDLHSAGMIVAVDGSLYLTDSGTRVRSVATDGTVATLAGGAERGFADGPAAAARFNGAMGLARDRAGNLYIADTENNRIRKLDRAGHVTTLAGSGTQGGTDGPSKIASFDTPAGLCVGPDDSIYVLEDIRDEPRVRRIAPDGRVATLVATVAAHR